MRFLPFKIASSLFLLMVMLTFEIDLCCQETSIYHNYYLSPFIINPAISGSENYPVMEVSIKKQWAGIINAPSTILLAGSFRIGNYGFYDPNGFVNKGFLDLKDRVGIGAAVFGDQNGPSRTVGGILSYAYHIPVNLKARLSFGLSLSGTYYSFNSSILKPDNQDDSYLLTGNNSRGRANFNFGTYYYNNIYFIGASATKILPDITIISSEVRELPSFFLYGGYKFLSNRPTNLEQSITIKEIGCDKLSVDFLTKLYFQRLNWVALSYSTTGRINILLGMHVIKMLYVGYNYEYTLSKIASYNYGSHEICLGINLGLIEVEGIKKTIN
jgi:type IX secretion system PorP/SprF family membrane protein